MSGGQRRRENKGGTASSLYATNRGRRGSQEQNVSRSVGMAATTRGAMPAVLACQPDAQVCSLAKRFQPAVAPSPVAASTPRLERTPSRPNPNRPPPNVLPGAPLVVLVDPHRVRATGAAKNENLHHRGRLFQSGDDRRAATATAGGRAHGAGDGVELHCRRHICGGRSRGGARRCRCHDCQDAKEQHHRGGGCGGDGERAALRQPVAVWGRGHRHCGKGVLKG